MSDELLRELEQSDRAITKLKTIVTRCRAAYQKIDGVYWSDTVVEELVERLTEVWLDCGHTVKATQGGDFDNYLSDGYRAAFNRDSSSNLLETARRFAESGKRGNINARS